MWKHHSPRKGKFILAAIAALSLGFGTASYAQGTQSRIDREESVEEVVVTGTYIKRQNQADVASPLDTIGFEDIEANGWTDIEDVAETMTFNTSSYGRSGLSTGCCGTARGIEVRALGSSSTLVLQNGKRVASTRTGRHGADMTNIKALMPVIAIDRIETLLDGGAALYGSDAVAGVVNIIPRENFEGFEMRTGGKAIEGSGQWEAQFIVGASNDRISGMFAIGFEHIDHMLQRERTFTLINNTSGNGTPGSYNLRVAHDHDDDPETPKVANMDWRPRTADGKDVIITNGFADHGTVNYSTLWDHAAKRTGPFTPEPVDPKDPKFDEITAARMVPPDTFRVADPYCRDGIVPNFENGRTSTGESGETIPGGGQFTASREFTGEFDDDGDPVTKASAFPLGSCRFTYQPSNSITPQENVMLMYSLWELSLTDTTTATIEYSGQRRNSWTEFIATFPMTNGKPIVPAENPFNPFGVDAIWTGRPMGNAYSPIRVSGEGVAERYSLTLDGSFADFIGADWAGGWSYELSAQYSHHYTDGEQPDSDLRMVQDALNGFGGPLCTVRFDGPAPSETAGVGNCYYFSPFAQNIYRDTFDHTSGYGSVANVDSDGDLVLASEEETRDLLGYSLQTESKSYSERSLVIFEGILTGDIFELPGGTAGMALGVQTRRQAFRSFITNFQQGYWQGFLTPRLGGTGARKVQAVFGELWLPLHRMVEVQLAARQESYDPGLSSTDPKIGVRFIPAEWLTLRASFGTSFRAASIGQVVGTNSSSTVTEIIDPLDPVEIDTGTGTFRTILVAKNPDLEPEESTSYNLGFSLVPQVPWGDDSHRFQIDFDWFSFTFENQIRAESAVQVVGGDPCSPKITRDPVNFIQGPNASKGPTPCPANVGNVLIVETSFFNSGQTEVNGADIGAVYSFDMGSNAFTIRSETSYINSYQIQESDDGDVVEGAGSKNSANPGSPVPQIRTNLFLTWRNGAHSVNTAIRYISSFDDDQWASFGVPLTEVEAHSEVDLQYGFVFGRDDRYTLALGAINLFNTEIPFARHNGWVPEVHNPYLRQLYGRISISL